MAIEFKDTVSAIAKKDILDLEAKIKKFRLGELSDDTFRLYRLARGVYIQRQPGVQMIRIKLPFGKVTKAQLLKIADVSDQFSTGNLHLTTRQDIQIHYVKLEDSPKVWAKLEEETVTLREACGNTVRNVTASPWSGIDPEELFDVTPYANAFFEYFLRNPICQEMGRKFKVSFSSSDKDNALSYIHDLGFIPKIVDGVKGFKIMLAGGLGAQPILAKVGSEFVPVDQIIPFSEAVIRVFDRYGERTRRHKARIKYLIQEIGYDTFMELVEKERVAIKNKTFVIDTNFNKIDETNLVAKATISATPSDDKKYQRWLGTNVFEQKQKGFYFINIRVLLGNMSSDTTRQFCKVVDQVAADDVRISINQGMVMRFVSKDNLPYLFNELDKLGFAEPGFDSVTDITTCPGTDTCNLGIASSYGITRVLEKMFIEEFPDMIYNNDIKIKISGCMNSCGQHGMATIGLHGSSIKHGEYVMPAMQLLLGGGTLGNGEGVAGEKVIKLPTKKMPDAFRVLFADYETNSLEGEYFNPYYLRQGKNYFYQLLKPLAEVKDATPDMFTDWDQTDLFATEVGVGECAAAVTDLVASLLQETCEKIDLAEQALEQNIFADSIYHSYAIMIGAAKALLTMKDVNGNTHIGIINEFQKNYVEDGSIVLNNTFEDYILQINQNEPTKQFAEKYLIDAKAFINTAIEYREAKIAAHLTV